MLEKEGNKEEAIMFFEQAADLYHTENSTAEASKCNLKVSRAGAARGRAWAVAWCQVLGAAQAAPGIWGPVAAAQERSGGALSGTRQVLRTTLYCRSAVPPVQIAQYSAELERYDRAVQLFEGVARQSVDNNLLKYRWELFSGLLINLVSLDCFH